MTTFKIAAAQTGSVKGDVAANVDIHMLTVMANHARPTGGWVPAGKSGIWSARGPVAAAGGTRECLVIAAETPAGWRGRVADLT